MPTPKQILEAVLFASDQPVGLSTLVEVLDDRGPEEVAALLREMSHEYDAAGRGVTLAEIAGGYQLLSRKECAPWIERMLRSRRKVRLSKAGLESLAIVAYRQPLVRMDVEKIRGVDSGGVLRTLLEKKLIKIIGKKDVPGKPLVYGTSRKFMEVFGLKDLSELPTLKDLEGLGPPSAEGILPLAGEEEEGGGAGEEDSPVEPNQEAKIDESPSEAPEDPF